MTGQVRPGSCDSSPEFGVPADTLGMLPPPSVAAVIPLYNQRPLLPRAVASVLRQTHEDFTLFVIDDGSTDGGPEWVEGLSDPRIRLLRNDCNGGPGFARNEGLRNSKASWVAFLDQDDEWRPNFLARAIAAAQRHPNVVAVFTGFATSHDAPRRNEPSEGLLEDYFAARIELRVSMTTSSILLSRSSAILAGGFPENYRYGEDIEMWFRLVCSGKVYFIPDQLCIRHLDAPESLTRSLDQQTRIDGLLQLIESHERYRANGLIPATILRSSAAFFANQRAHLAFHLIRAGRRREGLSYLLRRVRLQRSTWRLALRCLKKALHPSH